MVTAGEDWLFLLLRLHGIYAINSKRNFLSVTVYLTVLRNSYIVHFLICVGKKIISGDVFIQWFF